MAAKQSARASEMGKILMAGTTGFTVRKRTGVGIFIHFFMLAAMVVLGVSLLVYYKSEEGCILAIVIAVIFGMVAQNLEKMKKIKQSLEFMNALFSSALGKGYQFCCVVKSSGEIVFYNRPFQAVFPLYMNQPERALSKLLSLYNMSQEDQDKLKGMMSSNSEGTFATTLRPNLADPIAMTIHLDPVDRPTGFFILRGK